MLRWRKRIRKMTYMITDLVTIVIASIMTNLVYTTLLSRVLTISALEFVGFLSMSTIILMTLYLMLSIYEDTIEEQGVVTVKTIFKMFLSYIAASIILGAGLFYMNVSMSRAYIATFISMVIVTTVINRIILKVTQFQDTDKTGAMRNILVIGQSSRGKDYIKEIRKHDYLNFNIVGYISVKSPGVYDDVKHIGTLDDLVNVATDYVIDEITVARPLSYDIRLKEVLNQCQDMGITITMLLDTHNTSKIKAHVAMIGTIPVLKFHTVSLNESQLFAKRMLDVVGALVGMVLFGIVYVIIGPIIKLETPGAVIFKQDRVGKNGRIFKVWKFRSMGADAEKRKAALMGNNEMTGHMFKMSNDPRITKIGAFIRKTSIDELPQFYNVLKGDMSLVGTRPPTVNEVKNYEQHHRRRICITPGITGNWQVSGRSDIEDFEEVVQLDTDYIAEWSVWLDIKILLKTVWVVTVGRGSR